MKSYLIGALLGINVTIIWFLGIHLTSTEARVRHLSDTQIIIQAEMMICAEKVRDTVNDVLEEDRRLHGP